MCLAANCYYAEFRSSHVIINRRQLSSDKTIFYPSNPKGKIATIPECNVFLSPLLPRHGFCLVPEEKYEVHPFTALVVILLLEL